MRKKIYYLLILLAFMPVLVKAETITFDICESGCEYASIEDAAMYISSKEGTNHEVIINLHGGTHELSEVSFEFGDKISKLTFSGNNAVLNVERDVTISDINDFEMKDITINAGRDFELNVKNAILNNCNITAGSITFMGINNNEMNTELINNRSYLDNIFTIKDSTFSGISAALGNSITFDNSTLNNGFACAMADCYFEKSNIKGGIIGGYMLPGANVHIKAGNTLKEPIVRSLLTLNTPADLIDPMSNDGMLYEVAFMDQVDPNISRDLTNNIFYYQETNKTIKVETNISDYESEFVNTYENSEDYDEIKDLPISWTSENESVATIKDGKIIPGNAGNTDLIGKRGNDIYTIHLTVEKETLPEKINNVINNTLEKKTIKVPITGKVVKLWVVIVGALSLIVIGVCTILLIKKPTK